MGIEVSRTRKATKPCNFASVELPQFTEGFENVVSYIFAKYPCVSDYLKEIDGKSTETFSHSVSVAFHMYSLMCECGGFSANEIVEWVAGALVHDAGKLATENAVLHANSTLLNCKEKFENCSSETQNYKFSKDAAYAHMMRHSIDGEPIGVFHKFSGKMMMAVVGHHIDASVWKNASCGFKGATNSRKTWRETFGEGYVEGVLERWFKDATERDYRAVKLLSFVDQVEAMRSVRSYKGKMDWEHQDFANPKNSNKSTVLGVLRSSVAEGKVDNELACMAIDASFRKMWDEMDEASQDSMVRRMVALFSCGKKVALYEDKIEDILKDPSVGAEFFHKDSASNQYVLEDPRLPGGKISCNFDILCSSTLLKCKPPPGTKEHYTSTCENDCFER